MENRGSLQQMLQRGFFPGGKFKASESGWVYWSTENKRYPEKFISKQQKQRVIWMCAVYGPPGLGKTTTFHDVTNEMNTYEGNIRSAIEKPGEMAAI